MVYHQSLHRNNFFLPKFSLWFWISPYWYLICLWLKMGLSIGNPHSVIFSAASLSLNCSIFKAAIWPITTSGVSHTYSRFILRIFLYVKILANYIYIRIFIWKKIQLKSLQSLDSYFMMQKSKSKMAVI